MKAYEHKVQYYETDKMGVVHHSNYIRWFEEARTYLLDQLGIGYDRLETMGIISPVISVSCDYKSMTRFGEAVVIKTAIKQYTGVRLTIEYEIIDKVSEITRCTGETKHCFLDKSLKPVSLKRSFHEINSVIEQAKGEGLLE